MKQEAFEVLLNRRSVRDFKEDPIDEATLDAVLKAGTYAPTAGGTQGVKIVAVRTPEYVSAVKALNAKVLGNGVKDPYYGANTILIVFATPESRTPQLDGAAVTTNLVNAAYAAGLGSCWINRPQQMFAMEEGKALLKEWGLSEDLQGIASIALGWPGGEKPVAKARKKDYIVKV